jgi:hypothetical protein
MSFAHHGLKRAIGALALVTGLALAVHGAPAAHANAHFTGCVPTISAAGYTAWPGGVTVHGWCFSPNGSVGVDVYDTVTHTAILGASTKAANVYAVQICGSSGTCVWETLGSFTYSKNIPFSSCGHPLLVRAYDYGSGQWSAPAAATAQCLG